MSRDEVQCQSCDHSWLTQKKFESLSDPKCSECGSRQIELTDDNSKSGRRDRQVQEKLAPTGAEPDYVLAYIDTESGDPEELRDLVTEAGATPAEARRFVRWYARDTDLGDLGAGSDESVESNASGDTPDPVEVADRAAQQAAQRAVKASENGESGGGGDPPEAVAEARDKAVLEAADKIESAGEKLEKLSDAAVDLLIEAARQDPELQQELIDAIGVKTMAKMAANRDNLLKKLTIESDETEGNISESGENKLQQRMATATAAARENGNRPSSSAAGTGDERATAGDETDGGEKKVDDFTDFLDESTP